MKIIKFFVLVILFNTSYFISAVAQTHLYPGEQLIEINQIQTLFKFKKGDKNKPLMIFVPGAAHLARIAYGFPGGNPKDFLSYWLNQKGYSFLGISYPLGNPVFNKIYPAFNIQNWGNQIATLAQKILDDNNLSRHVVLIAWSMAGNVEEAATEALEKKHINVDAFIGLSAVTPLSYIGQTIKGYKGNIMSSNALFDAHYFYNFFIQLIKEQNTYNDHVIIPETIYTHEFLGNFPVALQGQGYYFENHQFVYRPINILNDSGVFRFEHTPWIGLILDDSTSIPKITLIDTNAWNYLRSEMLYSKYIAPIALSDQNKFSAIKMTLNKIPQYLSESVHGNHFFFVGQKGARKTAEKIILILNHIDSAKNDLSR